MKIILLILIASITIFAEYQKAKIDMHGGKSYSQFGSKSGGYGKNSMGISALLDSNSSKRTKKLEKK